MNRAERRSKGITKKEPTYQYTEEQLRAIIERENKERIEQIKKQSVSEALVLLFALPLEVLMDYYWPKTYQRKLPEFTSHLLDYYDDWQNGKLDLNDLQKDLWEFGGVRFELEGKYI